MLSFGLVHIEAEILMQITVGMLILPICLRAMSHRLRGFCTQEFRRFVKIDRGEVSTAVCNQTSWRSFFVNWIQPIALYIELNWIPCCFAAFYPKINACSTAGKPIDVSNCHATNGHWKTTIFTCIFHAFVGI